MNALRWLPIAFLACGLTPALAVDRHVPAGGSISATLAAAVAGDRVLVEQGTYFEHVTLKDAVELRGGYDGSFSEATRDPVANRTIIHGSGTGAAITSGSTVGASTIVDGFVLSGGGGSPGAGIVVSGGSPVFSNNEISGNRRAGIAGGAYVYGGSSARFDANTFQDNSSAGSGGGLRVESSPVVVVNNLFDANVAPHSGGALYVFASAVACTANTFRGNLAGEGGGGAYVQYATGVSFVNNRFEDDRALYGGGALVRDESNVSFQNNDFVDCHASASGGGIAAFTFTTISALDCRFDGCTAAKGGGGFWAHQCTVDVAGDEASASSPTSFFRDCTAGTTGGGVSLHESTGSVEAVRFSSCSGDSMGGGIYLLIGPYLIRRNVIESCQSFEGGGLALHWNRSPDDPLGRRSTIVNNTIYGCSATAPTTPGAVAFVALPGANPCRFDGNIVAFTALGSCLRSRNHSGSGTTPQPAVNCCTIFRAPGNTTALVTGGGCVNAWMSGGNNQPGGTVAGEGVDPLFCTDPPLDYTLQACSPCVDTIDANSCPDLGRENRGAAPDNTECPCRGVLSLEADSWGRVKARYR